MPHVHGMNEQHTEQHTEQPSAAPAQPSQAPSPRTDRAARLAILHAIATGATSYSRAAREHGLPIGTIKRWMHDARKRGTQAPQAPQAPTLQFANASPAPEPAEPAQPDDQPDTQPEPSDQPEPGEPPQLANPLSPRHSGFSPESLVIRETKGNFEKAELAELRGLARTLAQAVKAIAPHDLKQAKAGTDALGTVYELRRRAAGKPNGLEKPIASPRGQAPAVLIVGSGPIRVTKPRRKPEQATPPILEAETCKVASQPSPPSPLEAIEAALPAWQAAL